jgi:hypothetical protein
MMSESVVFFPVALPLDPTSVRLEPFGDKYVLRLANNDVLSVQPSGKVETRHAVGIWSSRGGFLTGWCVLMAPGRSITS